MLLHCKHKDVFCEDFMWVLLSLIGQNELLKITMQTGEDDCDNYVHGVSTNPLPALNLSHPFVLDHFLQEPI